MGNDGGSIPKRRELVKEAVRAQTASEVKESQQEQHSHQWTTCSLSQKPLQEPIVSDCLGVLYNKDAVLEYLLPADEAETQVAKSDGAKILGGRVNGLKDVVEVKFLAEKEQSNAGSTQGTPTWVCPITNKQLGPGVKAAYIVPCGHAFSEIALREVAELVCLQCNEAYSADNIVPILPLRQEDKARLQKRIDDLKAQGLSHSLKKASNKKKRKNAETNGAVAEAKAAKPALNGSTGNNGIKNAATASLTARVLAEEEERAKRRKAEGRDTLKSLFSSGEKKGSKDSDFMTRGFSIPAHARR